jgi:hypothetical protein
VKLHHGIPVLRSFDEALARRFYIEALGFTVDWEHRFEPELPLYMQVSRDDLVLHLSEHYGDGSPGGVVWIVVDDVRAWYDEIRKVPFELLHQRPGFEKDGPGGPGFSLGDPFHNQLRFAQPA